MYGFCAQLSSRTRLVPCAPRQRAEVAGRHQVLGVIEEDGDLLAARGSSSSRPRSIVRSRASSRFFRVARPGARLAPLGGEVLHHVLESLRRRRRPAGAGREPCRSAGPRPRSRTAARPGTPAGCSRSSPSPAGQRTRSWTLPCRTNRQVVPEKYSSASSRAQGGYHDGNSAARRRRGAWVLSGRW